MLHVHVYVIVLRYVILNHHMQAVQPTIVQLRFTRNSPCHADRLLSTRPYTCQYQQSRRTGPTSVSLVPDNCAPLNHWSYHVAVVYPGFQWGGCLKWGPIRKVGEGGVQFASGPIRKVGGGGGGGCSSLQVRYEKWGGGGGCSLLQVRYEKWGPLFGAQQIRYR